MNGRVSESGSASRLDLVTLYRRIPRLSTGSALALTILILVLLFVLMLMCTAPLRNTSTVVNASTFTVTRPSASTASCESSFGNRDGHQDRCNNSNGGDCSTFHLILLE